MQHQVLLLLLLLQLLLLEEVEASKKFGFSSVLILVMRNVPGMCRLAEEEQVECLMLKPECLEAI